MHLRVSRESWGQGQVGTEEAEWLWASMEGSGSRFSIPTGSGAPCSPTESPGIAQVTPVFCGTVYFLNLILQCQPQYQALDMHATFC